MRGNIDGYIVNGMQALKLNVPINTYAYPMGESGSDIIPNGLFSSSCILHALLNTNFWYTATLIGGNDYREYKYTRDFQLEKTITDAASAFWNAVQNDDVPPSTNQIDLRMMFPRHRDKSINISDDISGHLKI